MMENGLVQSLDQTLIVKVMSRCAIRISISFSFQHKARAQALDSDWKSKFDNRKNRRGKKNKYIKQLYLLRDVSGTCIVSWILVFVFIDDVLEHYSIPSQLFEREMSNTMEIPIIFKQSKMHISLFRRMEGPDNRKLPLLSRFPALL
ncbi:59b9b2b7-999d-4e8c-89e3-76057b4f3f26 [Sclerotinia trifoliorum]|uniref:59b9b2b7-999d-4e8c-89e3-76057b4f3f26 n=1 Tax=Sclerotinia trifoliorum TaxID=28548 RepID=A0A8H2ZQ77_9HELO|nr:59b9b2b7-999d-4e8c-89e3-76057b4f3f26 [Sclerotinia trifoliorum]